MAFLRQAKTEEDVKKMTVANVKKSYNDLASDYNKILNGDICKCPKCNEFVVRKNFYSSDDYSSGLFPICKKCILEMVEQRVKKTDPPKETKESVKAVLQLMDLPFIEELYDAQCRSVENEVNENNKKSPFIAYLVPIKSLPQYSTKKWKDSQYSVDVDSNEIKDNQKLIKNGKKRFGEGLRNEDYMFLENEYQDWIHRYECKTKAQESIFERLSFKKWEINKATKSNQNTKDLDKTYQDLLSTANITPKQNTMDSLSDAQTLGTLLQKWETERPLPEIDDELKDVDKIGLYIDVFFKGHLAKMMNIKNGFSNAYSSFMKKYTVSRPEYADDENSEALFDAIFGESASESEEKLDSVIDE